MKTTLLFLFVAFTQLCIAQTPLHFIELGSEPAYCRTAGYQSGNGVVYAAAQGGEGELSYLWTNVQTGATTSNTTWGGLNPGDYVIKVSDTVGNLLVETVKVDSVNPNAVFDMFSTNINYNNGVYQGVIPVEIELSGMWDSQYFFYPTYPGFQGPYWVSYYLDSLGWSDSLNFPVDLNGPESFTLEHPYVGQVCLSVVNYHGCADTICKQVQLLPPQTYQQPQASVAVSVNYNLSEITFINLSGGSYLIEVLTKNGSTVIEFGLSEDYRQVSFDRESGVYIYQVKDPVSGARLEANQFMY